MYVENMDLEGFDFLSPKNTLIVDDDFVVKLFQVPNNDLQLDLMFETLEERVVIPLFVKNIDKSIERIVEFFEELHKELLVEDE